MNLIKISIPEVDVTITERKQVIRGDEPRITPINGFIDFHLFPRDKGGIFMFYNINDELLFVGKKLVKLDNVLRSISKTMFLQLKITVMKYTALMHVS